MCCNTCIVEVTILIENIHFNILVYLWKIINTSNRATLLCSRVYLGQQQIPHLWGTGHFPWRFMLPATASISMVPYISPHFENSHFQGTQHWCCHARRKENLREPGSCSLSFKQLSLHFYRHYS
jgi:hypothetical protein